MIGVTERTEEPAEEAGGHMSGLFDIDGNGIVDPGEEYLAFRIWEEMTGNGEKEEKAEEEK